MRGMLKWISILILVLIIAAAVYPFAIGDMEALALDDAARAAMPGKTFVRLSDGMTHYEWAGPESGQPVVLIHGMTSPCFIWDYQFNALAEAGFHVLRYDLFGRGLSDRPRVKYTADLFDRQLCELLDAQGVKQPVDLAGLSMGGAIIVHFIDRHPERVRRFALFAPSGFPLHVPLKYRVIQWPLIGDWLMKAMGDKTMTASLKRQIRDDPKKSAELQLKTLEQMSYKGYKRAVLSTLRHNPLLELGEVYKRVGKSNRPGILFWGDKDHVVPFDHHKLVEAAIPGIEFHALAGLDHTANYESPETVNPLLIAFLKR